MNRTPKLFNCLDIVAALTLSTAVYAMEPEEGQKAPASKLFPVVINEELMQEARRIAQEKVLENLHAFSNTYFKTNDCMISYDLLYKSNKFSLKIDRIQYNHNIHWFNVSFLTEPNSVPTLNKDIIALLRYGIKPAYFDCESAFDGVAEALIAKGITLESLVGRESTFADSTETLEEANITTDSLEDKTRRRRRRTCTIS